jgi:hypothetical protein
MKGTQNCFGITKVNEILINTSITTNYILDISTSLLSIFGRPPAFEKL